MIELLEIQQRIKGIPVLVLYYFLVFLNFPFSSFLAYIPVLLNTSSMASKGYHF